jgi:hypothetical protein
MVISPSHPLLNSRANFEVSSNIPTLALQIYKFPVATPPHIQNRSHICRWADNLSQTKSQIIINQINHGLRSQSLWLRCHRRCQFNHNRSLSPRLSSRWSSYQRRERSFLSRSLWPVDILPLTGRRLSSCHRNCRGWRPDESLCMIHRSYFTSSELCRSLEHGLTKIVG